MLLQAGSSGRGRDFAARWAELIFTGDPDIDDRPVALQGPEGPHRRVAAAIPASVKMLPMAYTVVGESTAHAEEREQVFLNDLVDPMASLTLLSELMNYDFSRHGARRRRSPTSSSSRCPASEGWCRTCASTSATTCHPRRPRRPPRHAAAGPPLRRHRRPMSPTRWRSGSHTDACDGFVIAATHVPGAYEDVVRLVVPELQRRGLFRDRYAARRCGSTSVWQRPAVAMPTVR